jgi:dTDP-glucose 4,6-dehydratase
MKKINLLVTGGCGFIGSNFINYIFPKGKYKIFNVDAMYYCANENNIEESVQNSKDYKLITVNTRCQHIIDYVLNNYNIEYVIHFAAQSHVQASFDDSLQYTLDNILGTHTLLESCRKYGKIQKFIHVSTDEVYGESTMNEKMKTEQSVLCPTNPYAATKAGAELIAQSYNHSYKFPVIISRGNNVYGPHQYPEKIIPKFIHQLLRNEKVTIQGNGETVRAFLHAFDTARAFESILENGSIGEIYNIGSVEEISVIKLAEKLIEKIKNTKNYKEWIEYIEDRPFNDQRYYISCKKLQELGWSQTILLEEGIHSLIEHEKEVFDKKLS